MVSANNYYCYLHKTSDGQVFYVGKGSHGRAYTRSGRPSKWQKIANNGYTVEIVESNLSNEQALILEQREIKKYQDSIINVTSSSSVTKDLNYDDVKSRYYIDSTSPSGLSYLVDMGNCSKGQPVGTKNSNGKWRTKIFKKVFMVHRIIYLLAHGQIDPTKVIDHIDGNPSNNKVENLRQITVAENNRNTKRAPNSSGITGISIGKTKGVVKASISHNNKRFTKEFSIKVWGPDMAVQHAVIWRNNKVVELNKKGAMFTDRHCGNNQ